MANNSKGKDHPVTHKAAPAFGGVVATGFAGASVAVILLSGISVVASVFVFSVTTFFEASTFAVVGAAAFVVTAAAFVVAVVAFVVAAAAFVVAAAKHQT